MQMTLTNCSRCKSGFYTTASVRNTCCPFCGYSFMKTDQSEKRLESRKLIKKYLCAGKCMMTASAVDIYEI